MATVTLLTSEIRKCFWSMKKFSFTLSSVMSFKDKLEQERERTGKLQEVSFRTLGMIYESALHRTFRFGKFNSSFSYKVAARGSRTSCVPNLEVSERVFYRGLRVLESLGLIRRPYGGRRIYTNFVSFIREYCEFVKTIEPLTEKEKEVFEVVRDVGERLRKAGPYPAIVIRKDPHDKSDPYYRKVYLGVSGGPKKAKKSFNSHSKERAVNLQESVQSAKQKSEAVAKQKDERRASLNLISKRTGNPNPYVVLATFYRAAGRGGNTSYPVPTDKKMYRFAINYAKRALDAGMTEEELRAELEEVAAAWPELARCKISKVISKGDRKGMVREIVIPISPQFDFLYFNRTELLMLLSDLKAGEKKSAPAKARQPKTEEAPAPKKSSTQTRREAEVERLARLFREKRAKEMGITDLDVSAPVDRSDPLWELAFKDAEEEVRRLEEIERRHWAKYKTATSR